MGLSEYKALFEKRKVELEIETSVYNSPALEEKLLLVNFWLAAIAELERLDRG